MRSITFSKIRFFLSAKGCSGRSLNIKLLFCISLCFILNINLSFGSDRTEQISRSVWKISNNNARGTAFAIGPNQFITNFHIVAYFLKYKNSIKYVTLSQEGRDSKIQIKRVVAFSASYDLALLETEENVTDYLSIVDSSVEQSEKLSVFGYPGGVLKNLKKIGSVLDEDSYSYTFPVNYSKLGGLSGSPVLNGKGEVVGVISMSNMNIAIAIKAKLLQEFIAGEESTNCSHMRVKICLQKDIEASKNLSDAGNAYVQFALVLMYLNGIGVEKDEEKAFVWCEKSAKQNFVLAQFRLALMYLNGVGVEKDEEKAFEWYEKSAKLNYTPAQNKLAGMYLHGIGVEKDEKKVFEWYEKSAKLNYAPAQFRLALMYLHGIGVEKDEEKAFEWYEKSAKLNYAPAQFRLALMYLDGIGVEKDEEKAFEWYEKSAKLNYAPAQFRLALMYLHGIGVEKDEEKAFEWCEKSAKLNYALAQFRLALMYSNGIGVEKDEEKAFKWCEKSAKLNYTPDQFNCNHRLWVVLYRRLFLR